MNAGNWPSKDSAELRLAEFLRHISYFDRSLAPFLGCAQFMPELGPAFAPGRIPGIGQPGEDISVVETALRCKARLGDLIYGSILYWHQFRDGHESTPSEYHLHKDLYDFCLQLRAEREHEYANRVRAVYNAVFKVDLATIVIVPVDRPHFVQAGQSFSVKLMFLSFFSGDVYEMDISRNYAEIYESSKYIRFKTVGVETHPQEMVEVIVCQDLGACTIKPEIATQIQLPETADESQASRWDIQPQREGILRVAVVIRQGDQPVAHIPLIFEVLPPPHLSLLSILLALVAANAPRGTPHEAGVSSGLVMARSKSMLPELGESDHSNVAHAFADRISLLAAELTSLEGEFQLLKEEYLYLGGDGMATRLNHHLSEIETVSHRLKSMLFETKATPFGKGRSFLWRYLKNIVKCFDTIDRDATLFRGMVLRLRQDLTTFRGLAELRTRRIHSFSRRLWSQYAIATPGLLYIANSLDYPRVMLTGMSSEEADDSREYSDPVDGTNVDVGVGVVVGIDFGASCSIVAIPERLDEGVYDETTDVTLIEDDHVESDEDHKHIYFYRPYHVPSFCADHQGNFIVGRMARCRIGHHLLAFAKRWMVGEAWIQLGAWEPTAEDVLAAIFAYLKRISKHRIKRGIDGAVIALPAHCLVDGSSRSGEDLVRLVKSACEMAELFGPQIISEPEAAAHAHYFRDTSPQLRVMTCDLGGGSCEVAIVEKSGAKYNLRQVETDFRLSGFVLDSLLVDLIRNRLQHLGHELDRRRGSSAHARLMMLAEMARIALSEKESVEISMEDFGVLDAHGQPVCLKMRIWRYEIAIESYVEGVVATCHRLLKRAGLTVDDLDEVLLYGGCSGIPEVARRLRAEFKGKVHLSPHPDGNVAIGAAVRARQWFQGRTDTNHRR